MIDHVVFHSHDADLDAIFQERLQGPTDASLVLKHDDDTWRSTIIENLKDLMVQALFDPQDNSGDYYKTMFRNNIYFGTTADPNDGSMIHLDA